MKLILTVLIAFLSISCVKSSSIIEPISNLFYTHLNPIFQHTLEQLTQLVFELTGKLAQNVHHNLARINPPVTAPWVSQIFGEMNSITTQWNNQIAGFFSNIPTIFEQRGRSTIINYSVIKTAVHQAVESLLGKLKSLFINNINRLMLSIVNDLKQSNSGYYYDVEHNYDDLLNRFQDEVTIVFEKTQEQLNTTIDRAIDFIKTYWNDVKHRVFG